MSKRPNLEIGACNAYCELCPVFTRKEKRCYGCDWANQQLRRVRDTHKGCTLWECCQTRNIKCCFQCEEFPCEKHYKEGEVYQKTALDMWKELKKTGLNFPP